jgi:hypothetical protein
MAGAGAAVSEALNRIQYIKKAVQESVQADPLLGEEARIIEKKLEQIQGELSWDRTLGKRSEPQSPPLSQRVESQLGSTAAITNTRRYNYDLAAAAFAGLLEKTRQIIDIDLRQLEAKLEVAGVPWTPGREVPRWKKD